MNVAASADLVSIIVPVYNSAGCLGSCIDSILAQSHQNIEVVLVDDGSTDASGGICDDYGRKDGRVKVLHTPNRGASAARNAGITSSTGAFVFFVDSDDLIEPHAVQSLVDGHHRSRADLVVGSFNKMRNGTIIAHVEDFSADELMSRKGVADYVMAYLRNPRRHQMLMSSWGKLFRSAIIKAHDIKFDTILRTSEDVAFNFDYLRRADSVLFVSDLVYHQRKHSGYTSLSMRLAEDDPRSLFGFIAALNNVRRFLQGAFGAVEIDHAVGHYYVYHVILYLIRICGQINRVNKHRICGLVREVIRAPEFRNYLKHYVPAAGNYKAIPMLMRAGFVLPVVWFCSREAYRVYGTGKETVK